MQDHPVHIGPYDIVTELAAGGMATTYLAHKRGDLFFERLVVIKRIHPWLLREPNAREMLREEARLGAAIHHPHVVHVEDVATGDDEVCLVMPYVESLSLGALIKAVRAAGERIPPALTSRIMLDVLAGLDAAHEAKDLRGMPLEIVHRDISPNNVLVGSDGRSRIIDFGIARAARRLYQTQSGDMKGTIAYMSPEQLRRRELDRRADIFAAGAVLFEAITGQRLFEGRDEADILIGVLADEIPSVGQFISSAGAALDEVLSKALSRDREERFPTARAFAEALEVALPPAPPTAVGPFIERFGETEFSRRRTAIREFVDRQGRDSLEALPPPSSAASGAVDFQTKSKRDRRRKIGAALSLLALGTISAGFFFAGREVSRRTQSPESTPPRNVAPPDQHAMLVDSTEKPIGASSSLIASDLAHLAPMTSAMPNPTSSVRSKAPVREKVGNRRPAELQENPYR